MDRLGCRVGTLLLEAVRRAELLVFLRSGKFLGDDRPLAGERTDFFLAGNRATGLPDALQHRSYWGGSEPNTTDWRNGIYVQCQRAAVCPVAQPVSCGHAAAAAVCNRAFRL